MTTELETLFRKYAASHKKPIGPTPTGTASWDQMCAALMFRFSSYVTDHYIEQHVNASWRPRYVGNAIDVANHSKPLNKNYSRAPVGAFHFWDIGRYGHVGVDLRGKGVAVGMATRAVTTVLGAAIGFTSVAYYTRLKGAKYLGWSTGYAGAKLHVPATSRASTGGTKVVKPPITIEGAQDMELWFNVNKKDYYLRDGGKWHKLTHAQAVNISKRASKVSTPVSQAVMNDIMASLPNNSTVQAAADTNSGLVVRILRAIAAAITATK